MNQLKQNIAIAEHCGWRVFEAPDDNLLSRAPLWQVITPSGSKIQFWDEPIRCYGGAVDVITRRFRDATDAMNRCRVPDYLHDLNAMHEAEKTIRSPGLALWSEYARCLQRVCDLSLSSYLHATAPQRAEAFLKTIGKWEEPNTEK